MTMSPEDLRPPLDVIAGGAVAFPVLCCLLWALWVRRRRTDDLRRIAHDLGFEFLSDADALLLSIRLCSSGKWPLLT